MTPVRALPWLFAQIRRHPGFAVQSLVLVLLMAVVNLPLPLLQKLAVDHCIPAGQSLPLVLLGALALTVRALASAGQVFQNYVIWALMGRIGDDLRRRLGSTLLRLPYGQYADGHAAAAVGRLVGDVDRAEHTVYDVFRFIIRPTAMITAIAAVMLLVEWRLALLVLCCSPLAVLIGMWLDQDLERSEAEVLQRREGILAQVTEIIDKIRLIRAYDATERFRARVAASTADYTGAAVRLATRIQGLESMIEFIGMLPWLALVLVGALMVGDASISLGDFLLFVTLDQLLRSPLLQLSWYSLRLKAEMAAPGRIEELATMPREEQRGDEATGQGPGSRAPSSLRLVDVAFRYRPELPDVLTGLDLELAPGERVALVGPSGTGKSTLMQLLLGFHRPQRGRILLDGRDIGELGLVAVRRRIGVVFQRSPLLEGTIRDNLALGLPSDPTDAACWTALAGADLAEFVRGLPHGLQTAVGVRGLKLSGGQRQRLAIARVLLADPAIVLLDEATSSLDSLSEARIQAAFEHLLAGRTSLTIAHRLSTVISADRILFLDQGRLVEQGSHAGLLTAGGRYAELFRAQALGLDGGSGPQ